MTLPVILHNKIIDFLKSLPNLGDTKGQRAFIYSIGLDQQLKDQISFDGPLSQFVPFLVEILISYGKLSDGRDALQSILESAKNYVGIDRKAYCDGLIQELQYGIKDIPVSDQCLKISPKFPSLNYGKFIGRKKEFLRIQELLQPYPTSRYSIIIIHGIGGIGKTALALEVAYFYKHNNTICDYQHRFDAIIWVDARKSIRRVSTLDQLYNTIAKTLQNDVIDSELFDQQTELITDLLAKQQQVLLIIDNLDVIDDDRIFLFLRQIPSSTKIIITSRFKIHIGDISDVGKDYFIHVDGLSKEDVVDLILEKSYRLTVSHDEEKEYFDKIYHVTSGNPLVINLIIKLIDNGFNLEAAIRYLRHTGSDILKHIFDASIERLKNTPAYKIFTALSLFNNSASREVLGTITNLSLSDRDDGISLLVQHSLIIRVYERFGLLPLAKEAAITELQKSSSQMTLKEAHIKYYQDKIKYMKEEELNNEGENLLAIIDSALIDGQDEIICSLAKGIMKYLENQWGRRIHLEYGKNFYDSAARINNKPLRANLCVELSWLYRNAGDLETSDFFIEEGLALNYELGDIHEVCRCKNFKSRVLQARKKFEEAENVCREGIKLAEEHQYFNQIADLHAQWGRVLCDRGDWKEAQKHFEITIDWGKNHQEESHRIKSMLMWAIGFLGWTKFHTGEPQKAKDLINECLVFYQQDGNKDRTIKPQYWLAKIELYFGDRSLSLEIAKKARNDMKRAEIDDYGTGLRNDLDTHIKELEG